MPEQTTEPTPEAPTEMARPRAVERRIRAPIDFNGDRKEARPFLYSCLTYMILNHEVYPTDEQKIIFVLSYMVGGAAGAFREAYLEKALRDNGPSFGTWEEFQKEFMVAFEPLNPVDDAITEMKALKQTGTADDYVAAFRPLAIRSGIKEVAVLADYFLTGLTSGLTKSIMTVEKLPTTMDNYYHLATRLDLQWRKGLELNRGSQPKKNTTSTSGTTTSKPSNPVRLRKLTEEDRVKFRKEGRCFRCREVGHMQAECPQGGQSSSSTQRRQIRVATSTPAETPPSETQSAISRIRALYATFSPAEKEEVVNIAEAEGF